MTFATREGPTPGRRVGSESGGHRSIVGGGYGPGIGAEGRRVPAGNYEFAARMSEQARPIASASRDAGIALSAELTLDALLQQLVETAAELTGARYAALGVIDHSG